MLGKRDFEKAQVKNKAPATRQITAEQILREAAEGQPAQRDAQKHIIADESELSAYRMGKRKEFEDIIRRSRHQIGTWIKYAKWEESQLEFRRARSIYERALQVEYQNVNLWLKYIEMEISNKFIQHARTLYDRVTGLLPRVDQFWFKYAFMEERLENYAGARAIYEKWMEWKPPANAWLQYAKFEERCGENDRARFVYERLIQQDQSVDAFMKYCKFEEKAKEYEKARAGFETCIQLLDDSVLNEEVFIKYAQFELRRGDVEKANRVYRIGLSKLSEPGKSKQLYAAYVQHMKQTGTRDEIEQILLDKRRAHYERLFVEDPTNLDVCFDYIRMEEEANEIERVREIYERALAKVPVSKNKKFFKRYVYLWLFYAQFEEQVAKDIDRAQQVYSTAIELFGNMNIWFSKLVRGAAELQLRQLNIAGFRKILMSSLVSSSGMKLSISKFWIETELKLGNVNQARTVAAKVIEVNPSNVSSWLSFIDLEASLGETARAVALCELAWKNRESMDTSLDPLLRKWIDIETSIDNTDEVRRLFRLLVQETPGAESFIEFADFENNEMASHDRACAVLEEALEILPNNMKKDIEMIRSRLDELIADDTRQVDDI
jgi:crooked neck